MVPTQPEKLSENDSTSGKSAKILEFRDFNKNTGKMM